MGLIREHMAAMEAASYDRTWVEIDSLLEQAVQEMKTQHAKYKLRKLTGPKADKMRALMKYTRAKAVVETLRWTIGVRGQISPLDEPLRS
ncbi:MAG: hypothetical protein VXY68_05515 [Candidatus Thermoplasmatota archaeon]|nr:hypothetical protein [Candidatus Thermoplasmatota archaeon]